MGEPDGPSSESASSSSSSSSDGVVRAVADTSDGATPVDCGAVSGYQLAEGLAGRVAVAGTLVMPG